MDLALDVGVLSVRRTPAVLPSSCAEQALLSCERGHERLAVHLELVGVSCELERERANLIRVACSLTWEDAKFASQRCA